VKPVRVLMIAAAAMAVAGPAAAETAEEAVAYVFLGLADGGTLVRGPTTMKWVEAGGSPAVFDSDATVKGKPAKIRFTVKANDPCTYEIILEGPPKMVPGQKRLFAKVNLKDVAGVTITPDGFHQTVTGKGFCETGITNPDCLQMEEHDLFGPVDAERHKKSLAFLATEVCAPAKP
jgi:hypothetical protein